MDTMKQDAGISASCDHCTKIVQLRPSGLHMTLYDSGADGFYSFFCPNCTELSEKVMDFGIVCILKDIGVRHTMIHVPLEVLERKAIKEPVINNDDLLDAYLFVQKSDYLADLCQSNP